MAALPEAHSPITAAVIPSKGGVEASIIRDPLAGPNLLTAPPKGSDNYDVWAQANSKGRGKKSKQ